MSKKTKTKHTGERHPTLAQQRKSQIHPRPIVTLDSENASILRRPAPAANHLGYWIWQLAHDMTATLLAEGGVGLAAPQVGESVRLIVVKDHKTQQCVAMINPEILEAEGENKQNEACLSMPGYIAIDVPRAQKIRLKCQTLNGKPWTFWAEDMLARVIQHEVDHLNGIMILDRVPAMQIRRIKNHMLGESPVTAQGETKEPDGFVIEQDGPAQPSTEVPISETAPDVVE